MSSWLQRLVKEAGREGNWAYDKTFGQLGGWGGKMFGNDDPQHSTALGNYTRHLFNMSAGGAIPFGGPATGYAADYEGQRQLGNTRGRAAGIAGTNFGISLASLLGGAAAGGGSGGGSGAWGGEGAGSSSALGDIAGSGYGGFGSGLGGSGVFGSNAGIVSGDIANAGAGGLGSGLGGSGGAASGFGGEGGALGGMDWMKLAQKGMKGFGQGQQQGQQQSNPNDALLAQLLLRQPEQPIQSVPLWS